MDEILPREHVLLGLDARTRHDAFRAVAAAAERDGVTDSAEALRASFEQREREASTGLLDGFAIPHAKSAAARRVALYFARAKEPIAWKTMDGSRVSNMFFLIAPDGARGNPHLSLLSALASCLLEDEFKTAVARAATAPELVSLVREHIRREAEA